MKRKMPSKIPNTKKGNGRKGHEAAYETDDKPPCQTILLFVDAIDEDSVRLLLDTRSFTVPLALLPNGVGEGQWVRLAVTAAPAPPDRTTVRRQSLGHDDPGGNIKL